MIRFPWEGEEKVSAQEEIEIRTRSRPKLVIPCRRLGLGQLATHLNWRGAFYYIGPTGLYKARVISLIYIS